MEATTVEEAESPERFLFRAGLKSLWACGNLSSGTLHQMCLENL